MLLKTKFLLNHSERYDGRQLSSLWIYLNHHLSGSSGVAWIGPCHISLDQIKDGEDQKVNAMIAGDLMLHFIFELFELSLLAGVMFQRLLVTHLQQQIQSFIPTLDIWREGDDLYFADKRKLTISVAAPAVRSVLIHLGVNVTNSGTPVKTCSLTDVNIDPEKLAHKVLDAIGKEFNSMLEATYKVHAVGSFTRNS